MGVTRIQHNLSAMNAMSNYQGNQNALTGNLEKLSSGYRVNSAADDAAGLAISEKMRSQIAGLEKAQDNANDGISLVQTAEGALTEVNSMLTRLTTLATQSANGTYEDGVDRVNLQEETDALLSEIDRISQSTNFNGINLLDGSLSGAGSGGAAITGATIGTFKAAQKSTGTTSATAVNATSGFTFDKETIKIDNAQVTVDWSLLSAEDQQKIQQNWKTNKSKPAGDEAAAIIQDTINNALKDAGFSQSITVTAKTDTQDGGTNFTFESNEVSDNSRLLVVAQGAADSETATNTGVMTKLGGFSQGAAIDDEFTAAKADDMNGTFNMNINGTDYAIATSGITSASTGQEIADALSQAIQDTIDSYNDTVSADNKLTSADFTVEFTSDGRLKVNNGSDANIRFSDEKNSTDKVATALGISSTSSNVQGNGLELQIGDTNDSFQKVTVSIGDMSSKGLGLSGLDISNQDAAGEAIDTIKSAVNKVSLQRGQLGALQNRLDHTLNNLDATTQNIQAAESQIRDVDMAKEMTQYSKNNILVQAAQSMLAQANSMPQGVLSLLQ